MNTIESAVLQTGNTSDTELRAFIRHGERLIEDMGIFSQQDVPFAHDIRALVPPASDFKNPESADSTESDHARPHIASALVLAPLFIDSVQRIHPEIPIPKESIMQGLRFHDLDADGSPNRTHGLSVVTRFEQSGRHMQYDGQWPIIRFLVEHHSDWPDTQYGPIPAELKLALDIMCDIDASLLPRRGVGIPASEIIFRTPEAKVFGLLHIATALRLCAGDNSPVRGSVDDFLQAGVSLGLLREDPGEFHE